MASLAGLKISSGLPCMFARPLVSRNKAVRVAGGTLGSGENLMLRAGVGELNFAELTTMGEELQVGRLELRVARRAVFLVMAASTGPRVVKCLERMNLQPIASMTFGNVIPLVILG